MTISNRQDILHNKTTGLFYLGSALRFFDNEGRLNDYFMPGRVQQSINRKSTKVSYDLAQMIQKHGMGDFNLIALPFDCSFDDAKLKEREQL